MLNFSPTLVLNADYQPLSYYPLSLWSWQDSVKAVFLNRVDIVAEYDQVINSPTFSLKLPSVIALKEYISAKKDPPIDNEKYRNEENKFEKYFKENL